MDKIKRKIEAIFLDRDGTIGGDDTIHYPGVFELYPYTQALINKLKNNGVRLLSFTNQPGVSQGKATLQDFVDELTGFGLVLKVGDVITFERAFTVEDVDLFTKISRDEGFHHINPDEEGRLIIQGLLTATLPTKIGGDNNVLARTMNFEFLRPVFTGDTIICEVIIEKFEKQDSRTLISTSFLCRNQNEKMVLKGNFSGVIL